jgi:hypothetical protein
MRRPLAGGPQSVDKAQPDSAKNVVASFQNGADHATCVRAENGTLVNIAPMELMWKSSDSGD